MKDYYRILHVSRFSSEEEIKRSYRRLALKYHPDVSKDNEAHIKFAEVYEAYQVLIDPFSRSQYDNTYFQPVLNESHPKVEDRRYRRNVVYRPTKKTIDKITPVVKIIYKWMAIFGMICSMFIYIDWILPNRIIEGNFNKEGYYNTVVLEDKNFVFVELDNRRLILNNDRVELNCSKLFGFVRGVRPLKPRDSELLFVQNNFFTVFLFLSVVICSLSTILLSINKNGTFYIQVGTANTYLLIIQIISIITYMHPFI